MLLFFSNEDLFNFLTIKATHPRMLFHFFYWIDFLGNGYFFLAVLVILFLFNRKFFRAGLLSWAFTTILVNILKYFIFPMMERPSRIFPEHPSLNLLSNMNIFSENSFPSGHSASAFAVFFLLSVLFRNRWISILSFALAFLAAYARVYLFQHFPADILAGAVIGVGSSWVGVYLYRHRFID